MIKFKAGDKVFSYSLQEWGKVVKDYKDDCIQINFEKYGTSRYMANGKRYNIDKAPDLFFNEVYIDQQQRPLQDKDIVLCWNTCGNFERVYRFYDKENDHTFTRIGKRKGLKFNNMIYMRDEEAPQKLVELRDKLEG